MTDQPELSVVEPPAEDELEPLVPLNDPDLFPATVEPEVVEEDPDDVARRERKEESLRAIRHRAEIFIELSKTDAFKELRLEFHRMQERSKKRFVDETLAGKAIDQRQIDYDRGFMDGLAVIDKIVAGAENTLKKLDAQSADQALSEPDDEEERFTF